MTEPLSVVVGLPPQYPTDHLGRALGTRLCRIVDFGPMESPQHSHYEWVEKHQSAEQWDDEEARCGKTGLNAVWYLPRAVPYFRCDAVLHVAGYGRMVVDQAGFRAQHMEVLRIVHRHADKYVHLMLRSHWEPLGVPVQRVPARARGRLHLFQCGGVRWDGVFRGLPAEIVRNEDCSLCYAKFGDAVLADSEHSYWQLSLAGNVVICWPHEDDPPPHAMPYVRAMRAMLRRVFA